MNDASKKFNIPSKLFYNFRKPQVCMVNSLEISKIAKQQNFQKERLLCQHLSFHFCNHKFVTFDFDTKKVTSIYQYLCDFYYGEHSIAGNRGSTAYHCLVPIVQSVLSLGCGCGYPVLLFRNLLEIKMLKIQQSPGTTQYISRYVYNQ